VYGGGKHTLSCSDGSFVVAIVVPPQGKEGAANSLGGTDAIEIPLADMQLPVSVDLEEVAKQALAEAAAAILATDGGASATDPSPFIHWLTLG